jgi:hypothetical protein
MKSKQVKELQIFIGFTAFASTSLEPELFEQKIAYLLPFFCILL